MSILRLVLCALFLWCGSAEAFQVQSRPAPGGAASAGSWTTVIDYASVMTSQQTDSATRNFRLLIPANSLSTSGSKIRVTVKASDSNDAVISGMSIGISTTDYTFDATPTRITFDNGNNSKTVTAGTSVVSDEISYSFDKANRTLIHLYTTARNFKYNSSDTDNYYSNQTSDYTVSTGFVLSGSTTWIGVTKVEVYN